MSHKMDQNHSMPVEMTEEELSKETIEMQEVAVPGQHKEQQEENKLQEPLRDKGKNGRKESDYQL